MKRIKRKIAGILFVSIAALTLSTGGHGVLGATVSLSESDHHQAEHESGLTNDTVAAAHSEESQCHATDTQALLAIASSNVQVVLTEAVRTHRVVENVSSWKPIALSPRGKVPLFELANIHTTTLAQRV